MPEQGMPRQVLTMMVDTTAGVAPRSHEKPVLTTPVLTSAQLITLKVGSKIHIQAIVLRIVGTMKGRSKKARTKLRARKLWLITSAMARPPRSLRTVVTTV